MYEVTITKNCIVQGLLFIKEISDQTAKIKYNIKKIYFVLQVKYSPFFRLINTLTTSTDITTKINNLTI